MIGPIEKKPSIRIAGYLEKRGKMKLVVCRWKRWWFVLEGRLLLYYKSQLEYINLSPCRGSLNIGLATSVRPGKGLELTVTTRSQSLTLRACNRVEHEQWLQSLLDAMALTSSNPAIGSRPVMHFRYTQENQENIIERIKSLRCPSYSVMCKESRSTPTQPDSYKTSTSSSDSSVLSQGQPERCLLRRVVSDSRPLLRRPFKRNSVRLSKIAFSDTSIPVSTQECVSPAESTDKCQSMQELRNSQCVSDDRVDGNKISETEKVVTGSRESKLSNSIKIELNLEDVNSTNSESVKEQKIGNVKITLDGCTIYGSNEVIKTEVGIGNKLSDNKINGYEEGIDKRRLNTPLLSSKEAKSDPNLSIRRKVRGKSLSFENMQTLDRSIGSSYLDPSANVEVIGREQRMSLLLLEPCEGQARRKSNKKRSHSILSRLLDSPGESDGEPLGRGGTIRKRISFLRNMWRRKEKKTEEADYESNDYESITPVMELSSPDIEKAEDLLLSLERQQNCGPEPEPPPDYDISITEELEIPPMLPPRQKQHRPSSPWHDVPRNNRPVSPDLPPPLPQKTRQNICHQVMIKIGEDSSTIEQTQSSLGYDSVHCEPPSQHGEQKLEDLDNLLAQLTQVNTYVVQQIDVLQNCNGNTVQVSAASEPDYDIPRPHVSLVATLRAQSVHSDKITPTHFLCTTPLVDVDSLDPVINRFDMEMTPDSLECDSTWSLAQASDTPWSRHSDSSHSGSMVRHILNAEEKVFPDSLNS